MARVNDRVPIDTASRLARKKPLVESFTRTEGRQQAMIDGGWKKRDLPFMIGDALGIGVDDPATWVSPGDTVEVAWHEAIGLACIVFYEPTKHAHMKKLLSAFGVDWNEDRHSSANAPSKGGGNLKREAYLDLYLAILEVAEPEPGLPTDSWLLRAIRARRGQAQFRQALLVAYGERCAITDSAARSVLEAAHIRPFADGGKPHASNGLLLRSDIHTLFDLGLLRIRPDLTVEIDSELDGTEYEELEGQGLRLPQDVEVQPSQAALAQRWSGTTK